MSMPNASETIERLARESERRKILEIVKESESLEDAVEKIQALLSGG